LQKRERKAVPEKATAKVVKMGGQAIRKKKRREASAPDRGERKGYFSQKRGAAW